MGDRGRSRGDSGEDLRKVKASGSRNATGVSCAVLRAMAGIDLHGAGASVS